MDLQKTGELIALKRKELRLTQKMLADRLNISDRTVSKWERGIGFPDVSLIEPLADALELTVLELFRGEIEVPTPEEERSAREVLNICRPQMEARTSRARRWVIGMGILLILLIASLPWLITTAHGEWLVSSRITAQEAVKITPDILISTADYQLLEEILENETISEAYNTSFSDNLFLTGTKVADYQEQIIIDGEKPLFFDISVSTNNMIVKYGTQYKWIALEIRKGTVSKQIILCEFPYLTQEGENIPMGQRHGNRIDLDNQNNEAFQKGGYQTGWLELFRNTYY